MKRAWIDQNEKIISFHQIESGQLLEAEESAFWKKRIRQWIGIASAVIVYYFVHEGAHFLYSICSSVFKKINFMGIGVQIDVYADEMTNTQLGIFCLVGSIATLIAAYAVYRGLCA